MLGQNFERKILCCSCKFLVSDLSIGILSPKAKFKKSSKFIKPFEIILKMSWKKFGINFNVGTHRNLAIFSKFNLTAIFFKKNHSSPKIVTIAVAVTHYVLLFCQQQQQKFLFPIPSPPHHITTLHQWDWMMGWPGCCLFKPFYEKRWGVGVRLRPFSNFLSGGGGGDMVVMMLLMMMMACPPPIPSSN